MFASRLLLALIFTGHISSALAQAAPQEGRREPILTVLGRGRYEVKPDLARFQAVVSTDGRTLEEAGRSHEERATRAVAVLQSLRTSGLDLEKSNFRMDEQRVQRPLSPAQIAQGQRPETVVSGYTAKTTFSLKTASGEGLNDILTKLANSGLFRLETVRFHVVQERAALNRARSSAMLDALEQARAYAEPVDLELGPIIAITDGEAQPLDGAADLPARRTTRPYSVQIVPPAFVEFIATVSVTWRIAPKGAN